MVKTWKSVLILCLAAVFGAFIVLEAVGVRGGGSAAENSAASAEQADTTETAEGGLLAKEEQSTTSLSFVEEPKPQDVVTVLVELKGEPLVDTANARNITVRELCEGFDGASVLSSLRASVASAKEALAQYIVEDGYTYTSVFHGFSAKVRYGDIGEIEKNELVGAVALSNTYESPQAITENTVDVQDTGIFNSVGVGYDGTGTVVAVLDTGTDYTHEVFDMELDPATMALTKDEVAAAVPFLSATSMAAAAGEDAFDEDELYLTSKLPYAFDYADIDTNVYPEEAHGTHVAGIIAGESQRIRGVAPRAQIATFKVFQDTGNSTSEGILAALNDAVILDVDAINMSLGATCGFSREEDEPVITQVYDRVEASGVSLVVAAGNEYSSSYGGAHGNTNLVTNPDAGTVGSPATYYASLAVASVSGVKTPYMYVNGETEVYYRESRTTGKTKPNNFVNELLGDKQSGEYSYVLIPGVGYEANYTGIDVRGKIAVVKRGSNSFEDKVKIARAQGAVGVIIYNNLSGMLNMSIGTKNETPSCLVSMDYGAYFVAHPTGTLVISKDYLAGPFMSDFSSWGPLPNLELVPDITGHGGDITSSYPGGNEYDTISGTSMACPNIAGALDLVRQYVKNMGGSLTAKEVRDLSTNLMMSTAAIARNEEGNPYSPRKQGAGIGDVKRSVTTKAYLSVDGDGTTEYTKPKLSLKDDPTRNGVYTLQFNVTNLSDVALSYRIDPIVMTESMSSDGKTVAEKAYMLAPTATFAVTARNGSAALSGDTVSLGGYSEAQVTVTVTLSAEDRAYLNRNFANGMYVEGYVVLRSNNEDKIDLNLPFLAFYGNWEDAPMLDVTAYEVGESAVDSSVLPEDKLVADVYGTLPMAGFDTEDDNGVTQIGSWGLGAFGYNVAQGYSLPVTRERYASLSHSSDGNYMLYAIGAGLLRNAKRVDMEIRDSVTGELIWSATDWNARKSHSNGGDQAGGSVLVNFDVRNYDLANNSKYTFSMTCYLDWGDGTRGNRNTFSFEFYIDDEKPVLLNTYVRDENHRKTLEFNVYDNHYLQGYLIYTYEDLDSDGEPTGLTSVSNGVIPVENGEFNGTTRVSFDVTSSWSLIQQNGGKLYIQFMDYAKNSDQFFVNVNDCICKDISLTKTRTARDEYTVRPNGKIDLDDYIVKRANVNGDYFEGYWMQDLVWESSAPETAEVDDGLVVGLQQGSATITVHPAEGVTEANTIRFTVNVAGDPVALTAEEIELSEYLLSLERGESREIVATVKPERFAAGSYTLTWQSSNSNVTVTPIEGTDRAIVKANRSGSASVIVRLNGTYINATCSVRVKEEFYVDTVYLRSYTGRGDENGVVEIPEDLGVAYIYPMAFFNNPYITKIIIPEGVQYVMRAGIYGCDNLEEIVLPESCTQLQTFSVAWNPKLTKINTEHIQSIGSRAFVYDTALEEVDLSRATYISSMAFAYCTSLKDIDLSKVGVIGQQAFEGCTSLTELVLPANTSTMTAAFWQCTGLRRVTAYNSYIGPMTFQECTSLTDVTFVNDVETIDTQAFYGCTSLTNVTFLGSAYEIGPMAFAYDSSLRSFTLPAGLTKLGQLAFSGCNRLERIAVDKDACIIEADIAAFAGIGTLSEFDVEEGNKYLSDEGGVLYDKTMYRLIAYPYARRTTLFTVPDSVRVIGSNAFATVSSVTTVDLNNVERVEENAFRQSSALITGAENLVSIGDYAFAGAQSSSKITLLPVSSSTVYIGNYAFANCVSLTEKTFSVPSSVTFVGEYAFYNCPFETLDLTRATGLKTVGDGAFSYCTSLSTVELGSTLEAISTEMFANCTALREITIPDNVKTLGSYAFTAASRLATVNLPAGLTEIPAHCFRGTAVTTISIPETVRTVGDHAFDGTRLSYFDFMGIETVGEGAFSATSLTGVNSPKVRTVGVQAFYNCRSLTSVTLPNARSIGTSAFALCSSLQSADISSATSIGNNAFDGCERLRNVTAGRAQTIGNYAFSGAEQLSAISLAAAQSVGAWAFEDTNITTLNLPALREVASRAFAGAEALRTITVPASNVYFASFDGVLYRKNAGNFYTLVAYPLGKTETSYEVVKRTVKIGDYAFSGNTHLTSVTLPEHLKVIGAGAFYRANLITRITVRAVAAPLLESDVSVSSSGVVNTYNNFKETMGRAFTLRWVVPSNATGYNTHIWQTYLGSRIEATGDPQISASALDFIERVNALAQLPSDQRAAEVNMLKRIYSALDTTQQNFVCGGYDGTDYHARLEAAGSVAYVTSAGTSAAAPAAVSATEEASGGSGLWIACLVLALAACGTVAVMFKLTYEKRRK